MLSKSLIQAAVGNAAASLDITDVFSTWLYTGNGGTQTITNGIDLSGKGGLVWIKQRGGPDAHQLRDTARGGGWLASNSTNAQQASSTSDGTITSYNSNGFTLGTAGGNQTPNGSGYTFASWTFRKAAKFFDVVTYVGNSTAGRQIPHNLGSTPGFIIVKNVTTGGTYWMCYHQSLGNTKAIYLNTTDASSTDSAWNNTSPTNTVFTIGGGQFVNENGSTFVAYLFAHDAGGFGDSGNESVIKCGSYSGTGATGNFVNLGWEPQFVILKRADSATTGGWYLLDSMRGINSGSSDAQLFANNSSAESSFEVLSLNPTGFTLDNSTAGFNNSGGTYIYIAIRRGPMKTPTDATKVFDANKSTNATAAWTPGFPVDVLFNSRLSAASPYVASRLTGKKPTLRTSDIAAEINDGTDYYSFDATTNTMAQTFLQGVGDYLRYSFRRAPGFFDAVAYTGTEVVRTIAHNLGVAPEMIIIKNRSSATSWFVYTAPTAATDYLILNNTSAKAAASVLWNNTSPTASVFTLGTSTAVNAIGVNYIAYLFASCPGVSKVGSYTGTGTTLSIDCGFTNGVRFVLIKRTDSTGDWYVWDTARGIVANNDPYLLLNSTAAEVTNTDYIDPLSSGFQISSTAPAAINANGGSFIFLAVA